MSAKITIMNNGSIRVEGDFTIHDAEGREFGLAGRKTIGLCRCGNSENKPFCDGHHKLCGFASVIVARELPPPAPKPEIKPAPSATTQQADQTSDKA